MMIEQVMEAECGAICHEEKYTRIKQFVLAIVILEKRISASVSPEFKNGTFNLSAALVA